MELGIRHRSISLVPPSAADLDWLFAQYDDDDIWPMFGMAGPAQDQIRAAYASGNVIAGIIRRAADATRIGFVILFPPNDELLFWELACAIPDRAHRNAFAALQATDAAMHYMLDRLKAEAVGWRTRADNRRADAVVRRMGYTPYGQWAVDEHEYWFYRIDEGQWARRRERLEARADGPAFVLLSDAPESWPAR